mgnify:FL=1
MKKMRLALIALAVGMSGCMATTDTGLREFDLRKPIYEHHDTPIYMDLPTVQRRLYLHAQVCDIEYSFTKDPLQVHFATVRYGPAGATDLKDQMMLDLTAYATGKLGVVGYSYYAKNAPLISGVLQALAKPDRCPQGIPSKTK